MSETRPFYKTKPLWIHPRKVSSGSYTVIYVQKRRWSKNNSSKNKAILDSFPTGNECQKNGGRKMKMEIGTNDWTERKRGSALADCGWSLCFLRVCQNGTLSTELKNVNNFFL